MTIEDIRDQGLILFECISGSRAYGLNTPESDTDIKGVFILPENDFFGLNYIEQINNETNDIVFYEIKRFIELLAKNNPNIIELLATPEACIIYKHPLMDLIRTEDFLSKLCRDTFGRYAMTQVRKARGLNKKIVNPIAKERKSVLDFCYVGYGQSSVSIPDFLKKKGMKQEHCGLVKIPHMHNVYGLYYDEAGHYRGIIQKETSNEVTLSSVNRDTIPVAFMFFNKDGYSKYCKEYKEYFDWVALRNEIRYAGNIEHGRNYDSKNMMHTIRLLTMAEEIGREKKIYVNRPDREYMLKIKKGAFDYEELVAIAEQKVQEIEKIYETSTLQEQPDHTFINDLLVRIRKAFYV